MNAVIVVLHYRSGQRGHHHHHDWSSGSEYEESDYEMDDDEEDDDDEDDGVWRAAAMQQHWQDPYTNYLHYGTVMNDGRKRPMEREEDAFHPRHRPFIAGPPSDPRSHQQQG